MTSSLEASQMLTLFCLLILNQHVFSPTFLTVTLVRSDLYLLVNGKTEHRQLMHTIGRADGASCLHCGALAETLEHKFSTCPRVAAAWVHLKRVAAPILQRMRALTINDVLKPELHNIGPSRRRKFLQLINGYIHFIDTVNGRIDVNALDFHLNCEV